MLQNWEGKGNFFSARHAFSKSVQSGESEDRFLQEFSKRLLLAGDICRLDEAVNSRLMTATFGLLAMLLVLPERAAAQDPPPLAPQIMEVIQEARGLAPEFGADTLLRLAASRMVTDAAWKRRLVEDAFQAGARAELP